MKLQRRPFLSLAVLVLGLAACTQLDPAPPTSVQGVTTEPMPLPAFSGTFPDTLTRGFWFQAPVDFRIIGLRVPDEAGRGLQNVEVFKLDAAPPQFPETASGGQVFYKTGVTSGEVIPTNLTFAQGDFVGILGAAGDTSAMANSYGNGNFSSEVLGEAVTLRRFLTQTNIVTSGGDKPYSTEEGGSIARVEVYVAALETIAPTISLTTPADGATYQQDESVTVSYSCADEEGGSGLKSCTGTLENGSTLDTSTPGSYSFTVDTEDNGGNKASLTHNYTVEAPKVITPELYTIDLETAPTNRLLYSLKVGSGIRYSGDGTAKTNTVTVVGKRRLGSKILEGQQAKVISQSESNRLTIVSANSNTPTPQGGRLKLSFAPGFNPEGVTLTSLTLSNITKRDSYLTFYTTDGRSSRHYLKPAAPGASVVVALDVANVRAVDIFAPAAFSVDDVQFELPAAVEINPCRGATSRC